MTTLEKGISEDKPNNIAGDEDGDHEKESGVLKSIKRSIKALKKVQAENIALEVEYFKEVHNLQIKYENLARTLHEKRCEIINGTKELADEDCDTEINSESEEIIVDYMKETNLEQDEMNNPIQGIPSFWLNVLRNDLRIGDMIKEYDEPALKHLIDIRCCSSENPMGFALGFEFSPNDYFTDTILTKNYEMKCEPDLDDCLALGSPEIISCKGCKIHWKTGKNITRKVKKQRKSRPIPAKIITVQVESFFNFFQPPEPSDNEETIDKLNADFEIGYLIRDKIVKHALNYFMGYVEENYETDVTSDTSDEDIERDEGADGDDGNEYCPTQ